MELYSKKVIFLFLIVFLISLNSISASFGYDTDDGGSEVTINTWTGNLTSLSELVDTDVAGVNDDDVLTYNSATGKWEDAAPIAGSETDPFWTNNFTLYNATWSSTYNSTYHAFNLTGLIRNWNASGLILNWSGNYLTLAELLNFGYYNATTFSISDYYLKNNPFGFYNITNFDINNYLLQSNTTLAGNYSATTDFCIAGGACISGISAASGISWATATNGTLYLSSNPFGFYNSTEFSIADYYLKNNPFGFWNDTYASFNETYADTLYYGLSNPFGFYNSTTPQTETDPLWSANFTLYNSSWSLDTDTTYSHLSNFTDNVFGNATLSRIGDCASGQFVQNTTTSGVECAAPAGGGDVTGVLTTLDYYLYNGSSSGDIYLRFNETFAGINLAVNSSDFWDGLDSPLASWINMTNSSYYLTSNPFSFYNATDFNINDYLLQSNTTFAGNYSATEDFCIAGGACISGISAGGEPNWNANYSDFLVSYNYVTNDSFYLLANWNTNYSTNNLAWLNTTNTSYYLATNPFNFYNSTIFDYTDYRLLTNISFIGNLSATVDYCIDGGACLSAISGGSGITWATATNGTLYLSSNPFSFYNSTDFDIDDYLLSADWNATNTSYYLATNPFVFYNITNFDINNYYLKNNPYSYWNNTFATFNKTYADTLYYGLNNPFGFYNITNFDIGDYFTKTNILGFGYYNSTEFSIADYYLKNNPFNFYNSTIFDYNNYYLKSNPFTFWNDTYATFNKTYADTLYSLITEPLWTGNQSSYSTTSNILSWNYYNSTIFDYTDYRLLTNLTFIGSSIIIGDLNITGDASVEDINISGIANYTATGTIRSFSNGCNEISNSTGLFWIC